LPLVSFNQNILESIDLLSITNIGSGSFVNNSYLRKISIDYDSGFTVALSTFDTTFLSDLHVRNADGTEANEIVTKLTTAGCQFLTGFRLLY